MRHLQLLIPSLLATLVGLPLPAQAGMSYGDLCQRLITKTPLPQNQSYILLEKDQGEVPFEGDLTTCVIWQMAAFGQHQPNWDYAKAQVQGFNQQQRSLRDQIALDLRQGESDYPDLKALLELKYLQLQYSKTTGYRVTLGPGPTQK